MGNGNGESRLHLYGGMLLEEALQLLFGRVGFDPLLKHYDIGADSLSHGRTNPWTMERATFIVPAERSISRHFRADNSLCRIPVDAAMNTRVRSRIFNSSRRSLISRGVSTIGAAHFDAQVE